MAIDMSKHLNWGTLLKYVAPSIAMTIFTSIYGIVDGFFVSNYAGATAFAAVNFILPYIMILSSVGFMIGAGGSALVSKVRGEGDEAAASRHFSLLTYFALVCGLVLSVVGFFTMEPVAVAMGAEGEMLDLAVLYGQLSMISLTFYVLQYSFQSFFVCAGKPTLGFYVVVIAGVANIVLDVVFIGFVGMGVTGAALATVVSEYLGGGIPIIYFARKNSSFLKLGKTGLELAVVGRACLNGVSELMASIALSLVSILYNVQLLMFLGEDGVAAYGVIMYVAWIFYAVFEGYALGAAPLMSYQYGAQNRVEMRSLLRKGITFSFVSGAIMLAISQLVAGVIAAVFVGYDQALCSLTEYAFRVYALSFLLMGFSVFGSSFFTSLNNGVVSAIISFVRTLVFECGAVLLLPMLFGADGIWYSVIVAETAALLLTAGFMVALGNHYGYRPLLKKGE